MQHTQDTRRGKGPVRFWIYPGLIGLWLHASVAIQAEAKAKTVRKVATASESISGSTGMTSTLSKWMHGSRLFANLNLGLGIKSENASGDGSSSDSRSEGSSQMIPMVLTIVRVGLQWKAFEFGPILWIQHLYRGVPVDGRGRAQPASEDEEVESVNYWALGGFGEWNFLGELTDSKLMPAGGLAVLYSHANSSGHLAFSADFSLKISLIPKKLSLRSELRATLGSTRFQEMDKSFLDYQASFGIQSYF